MRRFFLMSPLLLIPALALAADSARPPIWTVHIDTVEKKSASTFESLEKREGELRRTIYAAHKFTPPPSWKMVAADGVWYTLRGRASLADVEKPSGTPAEVTSELQAKITPMDPSFHAALREHHNEIWALDEETSFTGPPRDARWPVRNALRLRFDHIRPGAEADYELVLRKLRAGLEAAKAPVALLAFESEYGDGSVILCWFATDRGVLKEWSGERILEKAEGPAESRRLMGLWKSSCASTREVDATYREDLSTADPLGP
jgi:hypothetical protein